MNPTDLANVVQAEALGVKPADPLTLTARLDAVAQRVAALETAVATLARVTRANNAAFEEEVKLQRRECLKGAA